MLTCHHRYRLLKDLLKENVQKPVCIYSVHNAFCEEESLRPDDVDKRHLHSLNYETKLTTP